MTLTAYAPVIAGYRSRCLLHWRALDGVLAALSGQAGTFTRSGTLTGSDLTGQTITYRDSQPAWTYLDTNADSVRDTLALRIGTSIGRVAWAVLPRHTSALTLYAQWYDRRTGSDSGYVADLVWDSGSVEYEFVLGHSGTQAYRAGASTGTPAYSTSGSVGGVGSRVEALATLTTAGVVQLSTSINGGATATASASSAVTRPSSPSDAGTLYTAFPANDVTGADLLVLKLVGGLRSMDEMREVR